MDNPVDNRTLAFEIVTSVVQDMSGELAYPSLSSVAPETELFGGPDGIDSLSLVRIVAEVEREAGEKVGRRVVLADDRAMSRRNSPFRTVTSLAELLSERLGERA
jgi:acyl carrier protein